MDRNRTLILVIFTLVALNIAVANSFAEVPKIENTDSYKAVSSLDLVAQPQTYLNQKIKANAIFDKFSTLGLDYKPAFRDSKDYISFLIKRDDVTDHTIPLSELKLLINRDKAEKLIDLESGDKIEFTGKVYSTALGDPWVEVDNVKILSAKAKKVVDKKPVLDQKIRDKNN